MQEIKYGENQNVLSSCRETSMKRIKKNVLAPDECVIEYQGVDVLGAGEALWCNRSVLSSGWETSVKRIKETVLAPEEPAMTKITDHRHNFHNGGDLYYHK